LYRHAKADEKCNTTLSIHGKLPVFLRISR
jgi:hypothetical protein